jgi:alkylation response protein AidB-like acyl-CoA dehydrogenase
LVATGSYDYAVMDVFIPDEFTFPRVMDLQARRGQPTLNLGIQLAALVGHLGVATGTAMRALEELVKVVDAGKQRFGSPPIKEQDLFLHDFAATEGRLMAARSFAFEAYRSALDTMASDGRISKVQAQRIVQSVAIVVEAADETVKWCYLWSGSAGLRNPHPLGRTIRDMLAQTQHFLVSTTWLTPAGKELLSVYRADPPI